MNDVEKRDRVAALYRSHGHVVLRRARQLLGSDADAQELLQDTFARLLGEDAPQVENLERPAAWLYAVTTRRALSQLRNSATRARLLAERVAPALDSIAPARSDRIAELSELLSSLPVEEAQAIIYFALDQLTHDEIAVQLGCSRRHVGNLLTRALGTLRAEPVEHAR